MWSVTALYRPLRGFVENSRKLERVVGRGRSRPKEGGSEGAEMKPMVGGGGGGGGAGAGVGLDGGGGEWDDQQGFHVYYLMVGVLVDWALSEPSALVLCLTEDMVIFLCVYLPTSTLFLFATLLQEPGPSPASPSASVSAWQPSPRRMPSDAC